MGQALLKSQKTYTYADYLAWPEDVRYEIIAGEAWLMAPAPTVDHQSVVGEIYRQLANALSGHPCRVLLAPVDVVLASADTADDQADTVVQPDVLVVCDGNKLTPRCVRGAPDWIMEVLSPSSAARDQVTKLAAYEKAGVREYWLAHPTDRVLTIYRLENGAYGRAVVQEMAGETALSALPGVVVQWEAIVALLSPQEP